MSKFFDDTMQGLLEATTWDYMNPPEEKKEEINLKRCPFCGGEVDIRGGNIDWIPTFYDPDSGDSGRPYEIRCECGVTFCIGCCDISELIEAWNTRKPAENVFDRLKEMFKHHNATKTVQRLVLETVEEELL